MVWTCPALASFWSNIESELTHTLCWQVPHDPMRMLLGVFDGLDGSRADKLFLGTALAVAKRDRGCMGKSPVPHPA